MQHDLEQLAHVIHEFYAERWRGVWPVVVGGSGVQRNRSLVDLFSMPSLTFDFVATRLHKINNTQI